MRQGHQFNNNNKQRMRGRNRKGPNPLTRSYESNGGDVKIRGTAIHIAEKYVQLARDAQASGDRVAAENYLQHAEHYYRIVAAAQAQMPQPQPVIRNDEEGDDEEDRGGEQQQGNGGYGERQPYAQQGEQPMGGQGEQQPYFNGGNGQGSGGDGRQGNQGGGDNRPYQGRDHRDRDDQGGGGYRGRRRRFYRDRYERGGNEQGPSDNQPQQGSGGGGDVDAPQGDE